MSEMSTSSHGYVIKRDGRTEKRIISKIENRIEKLKGDLQIESFEIIQKALPGFKQEMTTYEIDELIAEKAAEMTLTHPDYSLIAARISVSNHHKSTYDSFSKKIAALRNYIPDLLTKKENPLVTEEVYQFVMKHKKQLDEMIDYERDYRMDYFGFRTLFHRYLLRMKDKVVERPQDMWLRVAVGIWCPHRNDERKPQVIPLSEATQGKIRKVIRDSESLPISSLPGVQSTIETRKLTCDLTDDERLRNIKLTYDAMSNGAMTHATPTLFNSGTPLGALSSCFLMMVPDSIDGFGDSWKQAAMISKFAGGLGVCLSSVRGRGSYIAGTGGQSLGIPRLMKVFDDISQLVNQGGKRAGSFAMWIEPWHPDIMEFLEMKSQAGSEDLRARHLFYGVMLNDIFMERVQEDGEWSLLDPDECPGLVESYGDEFRKLYLKYEEEGRARRKIRAIDVMLSICAMQKESGMPYVSFKDSINRKNNQANIGNIRMSNLCSEICLYVDEEEIAVCNLASIGLPHFVGRGTPGSVATHGKVFKSGDFYFDLDALRITSSLGCRNLNRVIDVNRYPVVEAEKSNFRHRPIGIGVQGLANVFSLMKIPYDSDEAKVLNKLIAEAIQFGAMEESCRLAERYGPYETFAGSPMSRGILQHDMWEECPYGEPFKSSGYFKENSHESVFWDWEQLRERIKKFGLRNSTLTAYMPTASTSGILGNVECFLPYDALLYNRSTQSGQFFVAQRDFVIDMIGKGLWNEEMQQQVLAMDGIIQEIEEIPPEIRALYKTSWDVKVKDVIDMMVQRGPFIDQDQSTNFFIKNPTGQDLMKVHLYAWRKGSKSSNYYIHSHAVSFGAKHAIKKKVAKKKEECTPDENGVCLMCSA